MLRRSALVLFWLVATSNPLGAQLPFEDADLSSWRWLVDPNDVGMELVHFPSGVPYLVVRHRHFASGFRRAHSDVGSPLAVHDPALDGPLDRLTFAGRFRPHFEGRPPIYYSSRAIVAHPLVRQGGRTYVAGQPLFTWTSSLPLGLWAPAATPDLAAESFLLDGALPEHPDLSSTGAPLAFGVRVTTSFQAGDPQPDQHLFELDLDDFAVTGVAAPLGPAIFLPYSDRMQTERGPVAVTRFTHESGCVSTFGYYVSRTPPATDSVRAYLRPPGTSSGGRTFDFAPGQLSSTHVEAGGCGHSDGAGVLELHPPDHLPIVGPTALVTLLAGSLNDCSFSTVRRWQLDLERQGYRIADQTVARLGADDPEATLRRFRDEVMHTSPAGRRYAELYRTHSPAIVRTLAVRPHLLVDLIAAMNPWIDALGTLVAGVGSGSTVTGEMAADLNRLLDGLASAAPPALARAIAEERARLGLDSVAGLTVEQFWRRVEDRGEPEGCRPGPNTLCLNGARYRVEADFTSFGESPRRARAVSLSADSGYFWFFDPANVELLAKVLQGCGVNGRVWSYNAGLTNLEVDIFVLDDATGRGKVYRNESGESFAPILDSDLLECTEDPRPAPPSPSSPATTAPEPRVGALVTGGGACLADPTTLCLLGDRFRVTARWTTAAGATGAARAAPLTADTGTFWFFAPDNIELVVKAIDACTLAGFENHWLFAAGTTDVAVELTVEDTIAGEERVYRRTLGTPFAPVLDTASFATCASGAASGQASKSDSIDGEPAGGG